MLQKTVKTIHGKVEIVKYFKYLEEIIGENRTVMLSDRSKKK